MYFRFIFDMESIRKLIQRRRDYGPGDFVILIGPNDFMDESITCHRDVLMKTFKLANNETVCKHNILDLRQWYGNGTLLAVLRSYDSVRYHAESFGDLMIFMTAAAVAHHLDGDPLAKSFLGFIRKHMIEKTLPDEEIYRFTHDDDFDVGINGLSDSIEEKRFAELDARCSGHYVLDAEIHGKIFNRPLPFFDDVETNLDFSTYTQLHQLHQTHTTFERTLIRQTCVVSAWINILDMVESSFPMFLPEDVFSERCLNMVIGMLYAQDRTIPEENDIALQLRVLSFGCIYLRWTSYLCPVLPYFLDGNIILGWMSLSDLYVKNMFAVHYMCNFHRQHSHQWVYIFMYALFWTCGTSEKLDLVMKLVKRYEVFLDSELAKYVDDMCKVYSPHITPEDRRKITIMVDEMNQRKVHKLVVHESSELGEVWRHAADYRSEIEKNLTLLQ
jgi:hypothetical protein